MAREDIEFEARVTVSGTNGMAFYIPAPICKILKLKDQKNKKVDCVIDEDGDIIIDMESFHESD